MASTIQPHSSHRPIHHYITTILDFFPQQDHHHHHHRQRLKEEAETKMTAKTQFHKLAITTMSMVFLLLGSTLASLEDDCAQEITNLVDCQDYTTGKVNLPSNTCCGKVTEEKDSKPQCFCYFVKLAFDNPSSGLQYQRILQLPTTCKVTGAPSVSTCTEILGLKDPNDQLYKIFNNGTDITKNLSPPAVPPPKENMGYSDLRQQINHAGALLSAVASAFLLAVF